ncbi:MAG: hypothetical protein ABID45_00485, partial [Patescibacteria group bacterium]
MKETIAKCKECGGDFKIRAADAAFYDKINVPVPTLCPNCREQRRMCFRNERTLHLGKCDLCNKEIIRLQHPDSPLKVYCCDCWYGNDWDAAKYGRDFDFNRPFFEQFNELKKEVPRRNLHQIDSINSEYTNKSYNNENCYLCF